MSDFANGALSPTDGSEFTQALTNQKTAYLALYNVGVYAQDEWQIRPRLKLTGGIRFDRTGNPLCNNNCFSLYNGAFPYASVTTSTPYDKLVNADQPHPFSSVQRINPQGRFGFNYDVTGDGHTVVRGGVGMFTDLYPAGFLDGFIDNLPNVYNATIVSGNVGSAQVPGTAMANALASFNGVEAGFKNGASSSSLANTIPSYAPPTFTIGPPEFKNPTYLEFNLQVQHQFSKSDAIIVGYAGNVGYDEIITNGAVNAYSPTGFGGLPTAQPDPNFAGVTSYTNAAHSNYNGTSITYKHADNKGLTVDATYTYSKAMDDSSNGGITNEPYNFNSYYAKSNWQIDPYSVGHLNYSVSDYDIRNSFQLDFVYALPFQFHNRIENQVLSGWTVSGKSFYRSGQPFTVYNSAASGANTGGTDLGGVLVDIRQPAHQLPLRCRCRDHTLPFDNLRLHPYNAQTDFGNAARNQFNGPHYADTDLALQNKAVPPRSTEFPDRCECLQPLQPSQLRIAGRRHRQRRPWNHHLHRSSAHQPLRILPGRRCRRPRCPGLRQSQLLISSIRSICRDGFYRPILFRYQRAMGSRPACPESSYPPNVIRSSGLDSSAIRIRERGHNRTHGILVSRKC